jgi:DNA-binding NtrC family response regulator
MKSPIIVVGADEKHAADLSTMLERQNYRSVQSKSLAHLERLVRETSCHVVILDLDTMPVDNRALRELTRTYPGIRVLAVSGRRFHPELKESLSSYIFACLSKPVDSDELIYWLKSVSSDASVSGNRSTQDGQETPP